MATGTTSAFLGDERLLREFFVGDKKVQELRDSGCNVLLYLINDSYDPLNVRQLRIAVNKDKKLIQQFTPYCGQPIAEIPDPYGCCSSYAEHFIQSQLKRLNSLGIQPVVLDAYKAYRNGAYKHYVRTTFDYYEEIQHALAENFASFSMRNLFRAQCSSCKGINDTDIVEVALPSIRVHCNRCGDNTVQDIATIKGKLSWKLDCAARWNMYDIDYEAFSKAHITDLGSFDISAFISREFFGGNVPSPLKYGEVKMDNALSYKLIKVLPPTILKRLYTEHSERDLELSKASIEHFCRRYKVKGDVSYVDFVKNRLPVLALEQRLTDSQYYPESLSDCGIDEEQMVKFGNSFSYFYYGREFDISFSGAPAISSGDPEQATQAIEILNWTMALRNNQELEKNVLQEQVTQHLKARQAVPGLYPYMRRIFDQKQGASIAVLLSTLPIQFLNMICMAIGYYLSHSREKTIQRAELLSREDS